MVDKPNKDDQGDNPNKNNNGNKPSNSHATGDIDDMLLVMTILEENLEKDEKTDFKVKGWKAIAKKVGISEATAKIRFGGLKKEHKTRTTGRVPPIPVILPRHRGGKTGGNRGSCRSGTRSSNMAGIDDARRARQALFPSEDTQGEQEAANQQKEKSPSSTGSTESRGSRRATKMRAIPVSALAESPTSPQQQRGTKRSRIESEAEADSDHEDDEPTRKAPKRGTTADNAQPQVKQGAVKKNTVSTKTTDAKKASELETSAMRQETQHYHRTRGNTRSHQTGPSALAAGQLAPGRIWPWFHEERRRHEALQREDTTRSEGAVSPKEDEQSSGDSVGEAEDNK